MNKLVITLFISLIFVLFISCGQKSNGLKTGDKAILFSAKSYSAKQINLNQFKGQKILIHFWADWCADCRAEFPKLEALYHKLKNKNFTLLAVNVGQTREHVESFVDEFNLTFPMLMDEERTIAELYQIKGLPTNYFIDEDLNIEKIIIGWVNEKQVMQVINKE